MGNARELAHVTDYDGLIDALRARLVELNITHTTLDALAGWPIGYGGKVFGQARVRVLGQMSLGLALQALAVKLIVVEDVEAAEKMAPRWEQRVRPDYNAKRLATLGKSSINRMFPAVARELGSKGGRATFGNMTPTQLRRHQRKAGRARWAKAKGRR